MQKINRPELKALTSLRGIAAIFVLWHHFVFVLMGEVGKIIPSWVLFKSYLWVDLFFILSGFVLAYVYQNHFSQKCQADDYRHFMRARFARIYPLHLFILLLFVLSEAVQWWLIRSRVPGSEFLVPAFSGEHSIFTLMTNALMLQTFHWAAYWNQPAWSISAEWITYFAVPVMITFCLRASWAQLITLALAIIVSLACVENYFGTLGYDYAGWPMLIRCAGEAALGIMAFRAFSESKWNSIANASWTFPVFLLNIGLLAFHIPGVIQIPAFVWLVLCAARIPVDSKHLFHFTPLVWLGKISFSVYLLHWLLLDILRSAALFYTGKPLAESLNLIEEISVVVLSTLLIIFLSAICYYKIENPVRRKIMGR
jgi:peptidoglycan/LPS O-acetylase OafA/YrhL